jgi:hypothetical protein
VIVLALRMHLFVFRSSLGLGIDENREKGSKEDSYPNTAGQGNSYYKQYLNIHYYHATTISKYNTPNKDPKTHIGVVLQVLKIVN